MSEIGITPSFSKNEREWQRLFFLFSNMKILQVSGSGFEWHGKIINLFLLRVTETAQKSPII